MSEATSSENTARDLRETLESCIARLDRSEAVRVALVAVREGAISVADLHTTVLGPMLASIGTRWQHSNERVWEEHYASHVIRTIVDGIEHAAVLCLAPQNSRTSVGLYRSALEKAEPKFSYDFVESWHDHPALIRAFAERFAKEMRPRLNLPCPLPLLNEKPIQEREGQ